jgi:hypothetical protein
MKKILSSIIIVLVLFSCSEDFLNRPPTTGLSNDKLVDIPSMQALVYGAYGITRGFAETPGCYSTALVRDVLVRNNVNYPQFFDHQVSNPYSFYPNAYNALNEINTIAVSNLQEMEGTDNEKNSILGDMHFLRALIYFDLNNYYALPSTGYSVPLLQSPLGVNDRVSCARTEDVINAIEADIELARTYFENIPGVANYYAATALAARIYFFHKKYDKAYEMADEIIASGNYLIEGDVRIPFVPGANSRETIFSFKYNVSDGSGASPTQRLFNVYQDDETKGVYSLNPDGVLAQLMLADTSDERYKAFVNEQASLTYLDSKYSTEQMDLPYIRLAEMHLTRAEANIMVNNSVSQQDVDDINILRSRANPATVLSSIPSMEDALNILFDDRVKELAIEVGDHYLNVKRLEKGIVRIPSEGTGLKPYSEYSDLLAYPFPDDEIKIHGLTRNP